MKAMFLIFILIICIPNYDVNAQKIAERSIFSDNGKILDSLKTAFSCGEVEINIRHEKYQNTNRITVLMINSNKVLPYIDDTLKTNYQFRYIAKSIVNKLSKVKDYQVIEISFITRSTERGKQEKLFHAVAEFSIGNL